MRTLLRVALIIYFVYLAIALLLISPALNFLPHWYLQKNYGRELQTGWVLLNPFTLSLDISEAQLNNASGERFAAFSKASIDLSLESLWQPGWVLDTVNIRDLYLDVTRLAENEYNFSDLLGVDTTEAPPASEETPIPGVTIHDLELHSAAIVLNDQARSTAYISRWQGLHIRGTGISTVIEEGQPFSVEVEAEDGGKLQWAGEISIPRGHSAGNLSLSRLNLHKLWVYAEPWLAFQLKEGSLRIALEYQLNWNDGLSYQITNGQIGLSALDITPKNPAELPDTAVRLKALDISNIAVDSSAYKVSIDAVTVDELALASWMEESRISLPELFTVDLPADSTDDEQEESDLAWTVVLNKAQLRNGKVHWRSEFTDPQVLDIQPIELVAEHITWPFSGETRLTLNLTANERTSASVSGTLELDPGNGSIDYALQGLPLPWFNPNLPDALKATVTGGQVEIKGQVTLDDFSPAKIALDGKIRDFSVRREGVEVQLSGFELLRIKGLAVDMVEHSLLLKQLTIAGYTGRLHIHEDGSINASKVWQAEVGDEARQIAEDLSEDKPWSFSIPSIQISDSAIDFMDQSLPIQFRTVIGDLEGEVRDLSSDPGRAATVELNGSVDGYAPVALQGEVTPMATPTDLDLTLTFDGVDMALLSPYSGTYAGYVIDRGLLDLKLQYALKNNLLQGDNSIRVEKLKLGEKISSDKAVDLPLELALAILTDSNGVIDMAIPVKGDVNNPGFDLSGVIADALVNLLTKAVTAPFTLLANLVGTEDDLQRLTFTSGSSTVNDRNKEKLTELAAALEQRPKLSLVITGRLNKSADRKRLQRNTLKLVLREQGLSEEEIKAKGPDWEAAIAALSQGLPASGAVPVAETAREQYTRVLESITIPDEKMLALAGDRAVAVKRYLVTDAGLAAERAVVGQANLKDSDNEFSGVELGVGD